MTRAYTLMDVNGRKFWATIQQETVINKLLECPAGGIGTIHGYVPTSDWKVSPVVTIQGIFRFSTERLYKRRIEALKGVSFEDVKEAIAEDPKLSMLTESDAQALFNERHAGMIGTLEKTLSGDRNDSHREAHDLFYVGIGQGVKVHLASTKSDSDGLKHLTLIDGHPIADSIMVSYLEINRTYTTQGERKVVNSGAPVRMSNAIENQLNSRSVSYRTLALKEGNFESFALGGTVLESAELKADNKKYMLLTSVL